MNIPLVRNSGNKNQKRTRLSILATTTTTLLLSAISFIGIGAIPQPQQAFGQSSVEQLTEFCFSLQVADAGQLAEQVAAAGGNPTISESIGQLAEQVAAAGGNATEVEICMSS
jgi:hypothetical protein